MKKNQLDLETVNALHRSGQLDAAKTGYLKLLRTNPRNVDVLHALSIVCAQQDNLTEAIDHLQTALKFQPHHPILNLHLANLFKIQGLFSQAAHTLEHLLTTHPHYAPALNNLGTVYYAQAKLDHAVRCYRSAIEKQSDYVDAYYNLGLALSKQNKLADAIDIYQKLLSITPEHTAARFHLASLYMQSDDLDQAIKQFLKIEEVQPNHFETQTNLATCYLKKGALDEARLHYINALELMPHDLQILFNLGVINMQLGAIDIAIQHYQRALQVNPNDFAVHNNLAVAFLAKQHPHFALQHFQEAIRLQPNNAAIKHTLKILSENQHLLTSPPEYILSLFDSYADHYEPHLLTALEYKIPELFRSTFEKITTSSPKSLAILDIGCGTGLCGVQFKPFAKELTGVDLSPKMLEIAAKKNIYDELVTDDLSIFLSKKNSHYDLVIAGDVLVYVGDLADIFKKIHAALKSDGLFLFNAEITEDNDFKMTQSGRFVHSKKYLDQLAVEHHFSIIFYDTVVTRMQNNEPVYGHLYVMRHKI